MDSPLLESGCRARKPDDFGLDVFWGPPSTKNQIGGVGFPMTVAEPGAVGGKVSFLDALPPNVEAGKLRLWDVNPLTLWEVNVFSGGLQRFRNRGCSEGTLKRNG